MGLHLVEPREDRTSAINIATYSLTGAFLAVFIARQVMKAIVFRRVALDDLFILLATTFAIGLSVTTLVLTSKHFGVLEYLSIDRANSIMKGYYASELLYISSLCFSKLSIIVLFYNVVVLRTHRLFVFAFGVCIFTWSVASAAAVALQCELPKPWEMMTLRCFNTQIFWVVYCAIDVFTELFIVTLSVDLVAHLRVRMSRKIAVVACFAPRLLVVSAAVARAIYLYQVSPHDNPEYDLWITSICTQVHVSTSICTACIPYMVPFFKSLQGNIWRSYSTRSWTVRPRVRRETGQLPNRLRKREANIRFESPKSFTSLIKEPERVSIVSPRIPSPTPISPFLPPPIKTLQLPRHSPTAKETSGVKHSGVRGSVYYSNSGEDSGVISLQSAMAFWPSPFEAPTHARLSSVATIDVSDSFEYLALRGSPDPSNSSSCYSSRVSTPTRSESTPIFSLFPQSTRKYGSLHGALQQEFSLGQSPGQMQPSAAHDDEARLLARQTLPNPQLSHDFDDFAHPARSASSRSHPKFSTTPRLHAPSSTASPSNYV